MRKSACNKRKPRERARPRNFDISLFQRFSKMGASTADCIWQRAESIPEFLNHERSTIMKYRLLGKSGLRVSEASLGTMTFGDEWGWGSPKAEAQKVYETYREAGGNFVDTANIYTNGTSERFVGEFIQGHRESVVLSTKYSNGSNFALRLYDASFVALNVLSVPLRQYTLGNRIVFVGTIQAPIF